MGVSIQDRTDFLNMLDACRTEQQLFSRLTFAVMFHQTDPDAREDLLDDVRGAACNMQLPAVNYKIDQWLNTCKQAWQADPAAFMAAVNADAKQRKLALEGSAAQPGLLADVPMQSVAWLVPQRSIDWQPGVFWALAYSAILATAVAWSLWLYVLRNLPASVAGLSTLAVPVCGVLFSWWLLGENPGLVEGAGIVLIVAALAIISLKKRQPQITRQGITR